MDIICVFFDIFQNKLVHFIFVPISFQGKATVVPFSVFFDCVRKINSFRAGMFVSESNINFSSDDSKIDP